MAEKDEKIENEDFDTFKKLLITERERLLKDALSMEDEAITIQTESLSDESDIATYEENQHLNLRLKGREQVLLRKIEKALKRIEEKDYFDCETCGGLISKKRLMARPVTTMCISCKEAQEREEKHTAS